VAADVAACGEEQPQVEAVDGQGSGDQGGRGEAFGSKAAGLPLPGKGASVDLLSGSCCGGDGLLEVDFDQAADLGVVERDAVQISFVGKEVPVLEFTFDPGGGQGDGGLPDADGDEVAVGQVTQAELFVGFANSLGDVLAGVVMA